MWNEIKYTNSWRRRHTPYYIETTPDGPSLGTKYFKNWEEARAWVRWADEMVALKLPTGVTLDIRRPNTPFLARRKVGKTRYFKYFKTIPEAEAYLASLPSTQMG